MRTIERFLEKIISTIFHHPMIFLVIVCMIVIAIIYLNRKEDKEDEKK